MSDHISRKELKQDKIKETFELGAEALLSHGQLIAVIVVVALLGVGIAGGWNYYKNKTNTAAVKAFDAAKKAYDGRILTPGEPAEPGDATYPDENARAQDALQKMSAVAAKYPKTRAGQMARYYAALSLEDLDRFNQAVEELKHIDGSDPELAAMAQYQIATIDARTGKPDDAVKILRDLAQKNYVFVPRPMVMLELAAILRKSNPAEAQTTYEQIKKDFPDTAVSDEAERQLSLLAPKS